VKKPRKVRLVEHEICMEKISYKQKLQSEISKKRNNLKEIGLDRDNIKVT